MTKFLWGRLEGLKSPPQKEGVAPTTFWPWGRSSPSFPWSRCLWTLCVPRL